MRRKKHHALLSNAARQVIDDLRKRRKLITLTDGPLAGEYYVNNLYSYLCLPNIDRDNLLKYDAVGLHAREWLYYINTGGNSKHKSKGVEYKLEYTVREPNPPTVLNPYSTVIAAAKSAWMRKEFMLYRDQY